MAILEDNAAEFGISSPGTDYNEEIYAPVRLSNSTRRRLTPTEQAQQNVNMYSPSGRMMREQEDFELRREKELLAIDQMQDEAIDREISKRVKAAAWNDKVLAQKQAGEVSQALIDLDPTQPDYQSQVDMILRDRPLAPMDAKISGLLEGRGAIYTEAKKERERQQMMLDRNQERLDARKDNQEFQMDAARISREENTRTNIELKVADMSAEGQNTYKRLLEEGKQPMEAFQAARIDDKGVVTLKEANMANRLVQNYDRQISQAQKAIIAIDADLLKSDAEKAALKEPFQSQIEGWNTDKMLEQAVLDAYWDSKGGRPKPKQDDAQPTGGATPSSSTSPDAAESPRANAETPTIPLSTAIKKNPNIKPGQFVTVPVRNRRGTQIGTKTYLVTQ
jgi:hypothetical protein